jgi:hypothetical protein
MIFRIPGFSSSPDGVRGLVCAVEGSLFSRRGRTVEFDTGKGNLKNASRRIVDKIDDIRLGGVKIYR